MCCNINCDAIGDCNVGIVAHPAPLEVMAANAEKPFAAAWIEIVTHRKPQPLPGSAHRPKARLKSGLQWLAIAEVFWIVTSVTAQQPVRKIIIVKFIERI